MQPVRPAKAATARLKPITAAQKNKVRAKTVHLLETASKTLQQSLPVPEIRFDLSGRAAGMYCRQKQHHWIRFNPYIFAKHYESNLRDTVAHEVAHYLVALIHPDQGVQPHGQEWQAMMQLLGAKAERTHSYDLDGVPVKRQRRHRYRCACRVHELSTTRHNRMQNASQTYLCKLCGKALRIDQTT